jgi:two-component system response regulator AtoC
MSRSASVLIADDDVALARVLAALLTQIDLEPVCVSSGTGALAALEERPFDLVITDLRMPGMDGMALLSAVAARWPEVPVIMLTAHGTVQTAVEAMKAGAADFLLKPFDRQELVYVIQKALKAAEQQADAVSSAMVPPGDFVGGSPQMREVQALIERVGPGKATVLVLGETGTGKELVARALHASGARRSKPFVKLNCGALPDALLESELFGYEKGAFTGAAARKPGRVELADEGTLFLDEIGDITPPLQVKLLRVLQEREFERLGGTATLKVDVRFIAATHRDLPDLVAKGQFREDLYYRLNVVPIVLPPLRARREDIGPLARHFIAVHGESHQRRVSLDPAAMARLEREDWPGNVRQLQNFMERLVVLSEGPTITLAQVDRELASRPALTLVPPTAASAPAAGAASTLDAAVQNTEREAIREALTRAAGNRTVAARLLGVSRRALYYKLSEHGIG